MHIRLLHSCLLLYAIDWRIISIFITFRLIFITISRVDQLSTNQTRNEKKIYIYIPIEIQYKTCINSNQKSYSNRTSQRFDMSNKIDERGQKIVIEQK